jgi:hypothetical protein
VSPFFRLRHPEERFDTPFGLLTTGRSSDLPEYVYITDTGNDRICWYGINDGILKGEHYFGDASSLRNDSKVFVSTSRGYVITYDKIPKDVMVTGLLKRRLHPARFTVFHWTNRRIYYWRTQVFMELINTLVMVVIFALWVI